MQSKIPSIMLPPLPKQRNLVEKPEKPDRVKSLALMVPEVAGSTTLSVNDPSECLDAEEVASTVAETSPGDSAEDIDRRHVHSAHATLSSRLPIKSSTPKTLSAPWFTRPDFFSAELSAVFYRGWTYACHLSLLYPQGVVAGNVPDGTFRQLLLGEMDYFVLRVDGEWKAFRGIAPSRQTGIERATPLRTDGGQALRDEDCGLLNQTQLKIAQGLPTMALHITIPSNLVFVSPHPSGSFTEYFGDFEETLRDYDFESCTLHATWRSVGKFNWKTWVDGYSECLHCALAHPSLNKDYAIQKYRVDPVPGARYCRHSCPRRDETDTDTCDKELSGWGNAKGLWLFAYPGLALNCFSLGFYTIKVVPLDCQTTLLEREIFVRRTPNATAAVPTQPEVDTFMDFMKQVGEEDYELCELTQKNLEKGIYSRGMLHPVQEIGVWWYQQLVLSEVQDWARKRGIGDN